MMEFAETVPKSRMGMKFGQPIQVDQVVPLPARHKRNETAKKEMTAMVRLGRRKPKEELMEKGRGEEWAEKAVGRYRGVTQVAALERAVVVIQGGGYAQV